VHSWCTFQNMPSVDVGGGNVSPRVRRLHPEVAELRLARMDDFVASRRRHPGNRHEMFLDRNSDEVIKFIDTWLRKTSTRSPLQGPADNFRLILDVNRRGCTS